MEQRIKSGWLVRAGCTFTVWGIGPDQGYQAHDLTGRAFARSRFGATSWDFELIRGVSELRFRVKATSVEKAQ